MHYINGTMELNGEFESAFLQKERTQYCSVKENDLLRQAGGAGDAEGAEGENFTLPGASSAPSATSAN